jgi:hypothetical protein
MRANVAHAGSAKQRVGDRVQQSIGIRMAQQAFAVRHMHAAQHERSALYQGMDVPAFTDSNSHTPSLLFGLRVYAAAMERI